MANRRCRSLGLSLEDKTVETITRSTNNITSNGPWSSGQTFDTTRSFDERSGSDERLNSETESTPEKQQGNMQEPLVIPGFHTARFIMPVCTTLMCLVCQGPPLFTNPHPLDFEHLGHTATHVFIFSAMAAVALCSWLNLRKPELKVDARGIAYCDVLGVYSNFALWPEIASCDVVTERNVFGEVMHQSVILRGKRNKKLMTIRVASTVEEAKRRNAEPLATYLKSALMPEQPSAHLTINWSPEIVNINAPGKDMDNRHEGVANTIHRPCKELPG